MGWLLRPFFHPIVMVLVSSPLRFIFILTLLYSIWRFFVKIGIFFEKNGENNYTLRIPPRNNNSAKLYVIALLTLSMLLSLESEILFSITANNIKYEKRADVPKFEPLRLTPKAVAKRYADDTFQNPQEYLGDSQIILVDGKLKRIFPRLPDGGILYFLKKLSGFVTVDVDTLERKVDIENAEFKYADGIGIFDNIYFQLPLKKYFVSYSKEPIFIKNDEKEWVTIVPYISYRGIIFRVPYWAGVMVVHGDGKIDDLSPEEASNISYLKGNRIHPKEIVEFYSHSYAYLGGLINKWFLHENQTEIVSLPGDENIFHVATTEGFKQLVVAEPYGQSYGIYKIFIFDATTGKREIIEYDAKSQLTGPIAAADYIKKEFPTYDWNIFNLSEPRPIKIGDDLYWLLSIIPHDAAGIASTVLLNTRTNVVVDMKNESELKSFISKGLIPTIKEGDSKAQVNRKIEEIERLLLEVKKLVK